MNATRHAWAGLIACAGTAFGQLPPAPSDDPPAYDPVIRVPVPEAPRAKSSVVQAASAEAPPQGAAAFTKMLIDAKAAYAKTRDYVGHVVRQERVAGVLQEQQTGEIRVRTEPFAIDFKVVAPQAGAGWETAYMAGRKTEFVRYRPVGVKAMLSLKIDDPKALAGTRHAIYNTGLWAVIARAEKMVEVEKKARNPVQVVAAEYKFEERPCLRFEIFCDRPHPLRYAHRAVLYIDKETSLPVRWEAYDGPKPGEPAGELLESVSFVNLKFNVGLGDSAFDK